MMWIDIGVTLLLTLRIALSRQVLPRLLNTKNDASLTDGDEDVDEPSPFPQSARAQRAEFRNYIFM